jgi:hypothetical protein
LKKLEWVDFAQGLSFVTAVSKSVIRRRRRLSSSLLPDHIADFP